MSSCDLQIQELTRQIDIMLNGQRIEWNKEMRAVNNKLYLKEQECIIQKSTVEQKNAEIARLRKNIRDLEKSQHGMTSYYQKQFLSFKDEISKMKTSSIELQKKYSKQGDTSMRSNNNEKDLKKLLSTVESCNLKISALEKEKQELQVHMEGMDARSKENSISSQVIKLQAAIREKDAIINKQELNLKSMKEQLEALEQERKRANQMKNNSTSDDQISSQEEVTKLKLQVQQLQNIMQQKDDYINRSVNDSSKADNSKLLIKHLETDLYMAKQKIQSFNETESSLRNEIQLLKDKLKQGCSECDKFKKQLTQEKATSDKGSSALKEMKTEVAQLKDKLASVESRCHDELSESGRKLDRCKRELLDKEVLIKELKKSMQKIDKIKSQLNENSTNSKIELQVVTAQLNACKLENSNLRKIFMTDGSQLNETYAMKHFEELQQAYYQSLKTLETQNKQLESSVLLLKNSLNDLKKDGKLSSANGDGAAPPCGDSARKLVLSPAEATISRQGSRKSSPRKLRSNGQDVNGVMDSPVFRKICYPDEFPIKTPIRNLTKEFCCQKFLGLRSANNSNNNIVDCMDKDGNNDCKGAISEFSLSNENWLELCLLSSSFGDADCKSERSGSIDSSTQEFFRLQKAERDEMEQTFNQHLQLIENSNTFKAICS